MSKKMLQEIGKRCNVRGLDLIKCDSSMVDRENPKAKPREFIVVGVEGRKFVLQNRFSQNCLWKVLPKNICNLG